MRSHIPRGDPGLNSANAKCGHAIVQQRTRRLLRISGGPIIGVQLAAEIRWNHIIDVENQIADAWEKWWMAAEEYENARATLPWSIVANFMGGSLPAVVSRYPSSRHAQDGAPAG